MGTELAPETSENLHILTGFSARDTFIKFCRPESSKIYVFHWVCDIKGRKHDESVGEVRKLRKLSGSKEEEVTGGWRKINKEHVHGFCTPHLTLYG